jgi:hypothetical protein
MHFIRLPEPDANLAMPLRATHPLLVRIFGLPTAIRDHSSASLPMFGEACRVGGFGCSPLLCRPVGEGMSARRCA